LKLALRQPGKVCRLLTQIQQKRGDWLSLSEFSNIEVVAPPEGNSTPLAEKAAKFKLFKGQGSKFLDERPLLIRRQHIILVAKSLRQPRREEVRLMGGHTYRYRK